MENFWQYFLHKYGSKELEKAKQSINQSILYTLLLLEVNDHLLHLQQQINSDTSGAIYPPSISSSSSMKIKSFQWLAFDIVLRNSDQYQSFIVDILSIDQLRNQEQQDDKLTKTLTNQLQIDTYRLLSESSRISSNDKSKFDKFIEKIYKLIDDENNDADDDDNHLGIVGLNCHISKNICLNQKDFDYLIDTWKQMNHLISTNFQPVYPPSIHQPSATMTMKNELSNIRNLFEQILLELDDNQQQQQSQTDNDNKQKHFVYQTERLHPIFEALLSPEFDDNQSSMPSLPLDDQQHYFDPNHDLTNLNWTTINDNRQNQDRNSIECTKNPYNLSKLKYLNIIHPPGLEIQPKFQSLHRNYRLNQKLLYKNLFIELETKVEHCDTWIKLDDNNNHHHLNDQIQSGRLNFSIGIGLNSIKLILINRKLSDMDMVIAIYTIIIERQSIFEQQQQQPEQQQQQLDNNNNNKNQSLINYQICSLKQDCDLQIYPDESCGWQSIDEQQPNFTCSSIDDCFDHLKQEIPCKNGAENGRWLLPCTDCQRLDRCVWSKLQWLPYRCQYPIPIESEYLRKCLSNKNILLIGDSTNRGIMHYIMERLNRTLTEADKIHDHKTYLLMELNTMINFVYYPKFWLSQDQRPSFVQVFHDSIKET
uniref:Uncharacterized protein LOC113794678 n=1 Tax=Dermatophagoides pteronyssinus TaxID=6956 RepID=A0A6P6Y6G9_DERPT|nr:uncharacterized protein LOC113794678 [Dermatophagoides pteronyssinus]